MGINHERLEAAKVLTKGKMNELYDEVFYNKPPLDGKNPFDYIPAEDL